MPPRLVLATAALTLLLRPGPAASRADEPPTDRGVGAAVADFTLRDADGGREVALRDLRGRGPVVLFVDGNDCPLANLYLARLVELERAYRDHGVAVVAINANAHETDAQVAGHARAFGLTFPILRDPGNAVADALQVEWTCEVLLIDRDGVLRYRGMIDDQYGYRFRKGGPSRRYLAEALDCVLDGRAVETRATSVAGCRIDREVPRPRPSAAPALPEVDRVRPPSAALAAAFEASEAGEPVEVGAVTYCKDVAPIVQAKCQACHRPGQSGPMSLLDFDDARRWAATIGQVVDDRRMPPWHADPRFGHFANDRRLSARERAVLLAWVDQGAPEGDPGDLPPPRDFPDDWSIGAPDLVFEMPADYAVPPEGVVPYERFRVPTHFEEDVWVQAIEARPGDARVVHHIVVYVLPPGGAEDRAREHLVAYAPGDLPTVCPEGTAKLIPAGSDLLFELHYTPVGRVRLDRSKIGLILAKGPPTRRAITIPIANARFEIPPGAPDHEVAADFRFTFDAELIGFFPHMHVRGKDFLYRLVPPEGEGEPETLLSVPAYDFGWQSYYNLAEPRAVPRGTVIECVAHFDNSAGNPANPDPSKPVRWGDQTWEEMMIGYVDITVDIPDDAGAAPERGAGVGFPPSQPIR